MTGPAAAVVRALARAAALVRRVIGAPDYDRYVSHAASSGGEVMSRRQFTDARLAAKYDKPGSRCC